MRTEFIEAPTKVAAYHTAPWATIIVPVCGGFKAFESLEQYKTWRAQK